MNSNILAAIAGGLQGGFKTNQDLDAIERDEAQKRAQMALQRDQLARAIAQDQASNAHQRTIEQQGARQLEGAEDQRLFNQSEAMVNRGFQGPVTKDQLAKLHPTTQALAFKEIERPEAGGLMGFDGSQSQDLAPKPEDWTPLYSQKQGESERMRIAEIQAQQRMAQAMGQNQRGAEDRASREGIAASDRQTRMMIAAMAGQRSNTPKTRSVISGDANRIAESNAAVESLRREGRVLRDIKTGAASQLGAAVPNIVTEFTGWGREPKKAQALVNLVRQRIGKALEGGVLRKEDELKYKDILATVGDDPDVALEKLAIVEQSMEDNLDWTLNGLEDSNYDISKHRARIEGRRKGYGTPGPAANPAITAAIGGQPAAGPVRRRWNPQTGKVE